MALLPRMGQGALQDESNVRNTLRANVAEKLADTWLAAHLCEKKKKTDDFYRCEHNKDSCFNKTHLSLSQAWVRFVTKAYTNLGSFPLLNANTIKTLDEVVQHLCLLARFNGEAVTG